MHRSAVEAEQVELGGLAAPAAVAAVVGVLEQVAVAELAAELLGGAQHAERGEHLALVASQARREGGVQLAQRGLPPPPAVRGQAIPTAAPAARGSAAGAAQ